MIHFVIRPQFLVKAGSSSQSCIGRTVRAASPPRTIRLRHQLSRTVHPVIAQGNHPAPSTTLSRAARPVILQRNVPKALPHSTPCSTVVQPQCILTLHHRLRKTRVSEDPTPLIPREVTAKGQYGLQIMVLSSRGFNGKMHHSSTGRKHGSASSLDSLPGHECAVVSNHGAPSRCLDTPSRWCRISQHQVPSA